MIIAEGKVFLLGGILNSQDFGPREVQGLVGVVRGSVSQNMCGVVDTEGKLFAWGRGEILEGTQLQPVCLNNIEAVDIICRETYCCVVRRGDVRVYGKLGGCGELGDYKIKGNPLSLQGSEGFIVGLGEDGIPFLFDGCGKVVDLPVESGDQFQTVKVHNARVYGVTRDTGMLYEWKYPGRCVVKTWTAKVFRLSSEIQLGDAMCIINNHAARIPDTIAVLSKELSSRARELSHIELLSNSPMTPVCMSTESPAFIARWSSFRTSTQSFDDLNRLYPIGDNMQTIETIIKYRIEHEQRVVIESAFFPLIYSLLKTGLEKIKEHVNLKIIHQTTFSVANLSSVLSQLYQRNKFSCYSCAFISLKTAFDKHYSSIASSMNNQIDREEATRSILYTVADAFFRITLQSFSVLKDLELQSLQKTTSVLSMREVVSHITSRLLKQRISQWRTNHTKKQSKINSTTRIVTGLLHTAYGTFFALLANLNLEYIAKEEGVRRIGTVMSRNTKLYTLKPHMDAWKKAVIDRKVELINKKCILHIAVNTLFMRIDYMLKRSYRLGYSVLAPFSSKNKRTHWKLGCIILFAVLLRCTSRLQYRPLKIMKRIKAESSQSTYKSLASQTETTKPFRFFKSNTGKPPLESVKKHKDEPPSKSLGKDKNKTPSKSMNFGSSKTMKPPPPNSSKDMLATTRSSGGEKRIEIYTLQAYQQQQVDKYVEYTKTHSSIGSRFFNRPPWKPASATGNFIQAATKLKRNTRRSEYAKNLKHKGSHPVFFRNLVHGSPEEKIEREAVEFQLEMRYRLGITALDLVLDRLLYDRMISWICQLKLKTVRRK